MNSKGVAEGKTPAVVLGLSPTGLYVVRELGQAGIPVIGVASEMQAGCKSRYLSDIIIESDESLRLEKLLDRFTGYGSRAVLIPTSDQDIEFIISNADRLGPCFVFQESYADGTADILLTKELFYEQCQQHTVAYPRLWKGLPTEIDVLRDEIQYPCMIKPSRIHEIKTQLAGKKGWIVKDQKQFDQIISKIPAEAGVLLLQEIIPGPESEISLYTAYFDSEGRAHQSFTAQKIRQYPPGFGSASLVRSQQDVEAKQVAERLLRVIRYRGIVAAEFKRDPRDGILKIIEMNARPSLWFSATTAAGKKITLAAYHDLAGTKTRVDEEDQIDGVFWRYTGKDIYSSIFYRVNPDFILPPPQVPLIPRTSIRINAVYTKDDPVPVIVELANMIRKSLHRLIRRK